MFKEKRLVFHNGHPGTHNGNEAREFGVVSGPLTILAFAGALAAAVHYCPPPVGQTRARVSELMSGQCQASNPDFFVLAQDQVCEQ